MADIDKLTQLSLQDLENAFLAAADIAYRGDDSGDAALSAMSKELLHRGPDGEECARRLFGHPNPEVRLSLAHAAFAATWEVALAAQTMRAMLESTEGNGWYALWARKALIHWSDRCGPIPE